jgi:hypothetical protein
MEPDERHKKAFDFAADLTKQLITLSTGIITVALLFGEKFPHEQSAKAAFIFYTLSTICGVWTLMALTGTLAPVNEKVSDDLTLGGNVRLPSALQILTFGAASVCTLCFVIRNY